jgi:drug/metabolite transporter (DMT)-like permease
MFYYFLSALVFSGLYALPHWKMPNLYTIALLFAVGIFGTAYQEFLIRASANAAPFIVAPLLNLTVPVSGVYEWIIWNKAPDLLSIIGIIIVWLSGYYIIRQSKQ